MTNKNTDDIVVAGKVLKENIYLFLFKRYIRNILVMLDQALNVLTFGDEDETISSRLGKSQRGDFGPVSQSLSLPLAKLVDLIALKVFKDPNHCETNIEESVGKNALKALYNDYAKQVANKKE